MAVTAIGESINYPDLKESNITPNIPIPLK